MELTLEQKKNFEKLFNTNNDDAITIDEIQNVALAYGIAIKITAMPCRNESFEIEAESIIYENGKYSPLKCKIVTGSLYRSAIYPNSALRSYLNEAVVKLMNKIFE